MKPDAVIEIRLKNTEEGGRKGAVIGDFHGCVLLIDGEAFDCRLILRGRRLELGETYEVAVKFLNRDLVAPKLAVGKPLSLWEGKEIATGTVLSLM